MLTFGRLIACYHSEVFKEKLEICSEITAEVSLQVSQVSSNSKMVSWGGVSVDLDVDNNSDSGRGTEILERETKPNLEGGEKVNVKIAVGMKGK